jgi:hypothetical protein
MGIYFGFEEHSENRPSAFIAIQEQLGLALLVSNDGLAAYFERLRKGRLPKARGTNVYRSESL